MNVSAYTLTSAMRGLFRFTANFRQRLATFADSSMFEKNYRLQDIQLSKIRRAFRLGETRSRRIATSCQSLVENTGLEPVTSWLQTRRSPS